ncbi:MAG TPA: hypothetical protein VGJ03_13335 [Acidimicrobiales bacterium]
MTGATDRVRLGIGFAVFMAFGWWVTAQEPFSTAGTVGVLAAGIALIVAARMTRRDEAEPPDVPPTGMRRGAVLWGGLAALAVVWELVTLFGQPRSEHPTISSILDPLQASHGFRWLLFGGWLAFGWSLAR